MIIIDIAAGNWLDGQCLILGRGKIFLSTPQHLDGSKAHPASCPMVTGALSPGVSWLGCEAENSENLYYTFFFLNSENFNYSSSQSISAV
jgi:hypothetical protein